MLKRTPEARLVESATLTPCQVLKVARHGSKTSTTQPFLDLAQPSVALISSGADNRFGTLIQMYLRGWRR